MIERLKAAFAFITGRWQLILGIVAAVSLAYIWGQHVGRKAADSEWGAAMNKVVADGIARARAADAQRTTEVTTANDHITQAREDLDNATRNLPDESPSARRRARLCAELREQARRASAPAPAC